MDSKAAAAPARMKNPAALIPDAWQAIQALHASTGKGGVPAATLQLVHLRASQVNGCSFCVDSGWRAARDAGETDERLFSVAAWRDAPYFTGAERAALALAEAATRLSDRADPVPDEIWDEDNLAKARGWSWSPAAPGRSAGRCRHAPVLFGQI